MTRQNLEQLSLPPDATGVELSIERQRTPEVALTLHPGTERVYLMGGSSASDRRGVALARRLVAATAPKVEVVSLSGLPLAEQLSRLAALPPHSVVIFTSYRADSLGRSMVGFDVLRLAPRPSSAPTYGAADTWFGHGIVGGDLIQYAEMARRGGAIAARVLKGISPAGVLFGSNDGYIYMLHLKDGKKQWGFNAGSPVGSTPAVIKDRYYVLAEDGRLIAFGKK